MAASHPPAVKAVRNFAGGEEMIRRLTDQSPRALLDTITAPDEAYGGRDMIEMIRQGDHESFDRCLRQLQGDGFS